MQRESYELEKRRITQEVDCILDEIIEGFRTGLSTEFYSFCKRLTNNRKTRSKNKGRLRDMVVYLCLKAEGAGELSDTHRRIIAAGELYNIASYYQNWHLDDKSEVRTEYDRKMCHVASHLFRESAHKTISETDIPDYIKIRLLNELQKSNTAIQFGQASELTDLTFEKKSHSEDFKIFLPKYIQRCYWFSGVFYGASFAMAPLLLESDQDTVKKYRTIGQLFGTGGQIINDVGDFCLSSTAAHLVEKDYQDQFADMVKGTITLPIWELSKHVDISNYVVYGMNLEQKQECLMKMIEHRSFDSARRMTNKIRNQAMREVGKITGSTHRDCLKSMIRTFFDSNKFYHSLREEGSYDWSLASKNVLEVYDPCQIITELSEE